jgi:hypothetical protein
VEMTECRNRVPTTVEMIRDKIELLPRKIVILLHGTFGDRYVTP